MLYCYIVLVLTNKKVGAYLALCESNMIHLYAIALFLPSKFTLHTNDCSSVVLCTIALLRLNKHVSYEHLLCIHNDTHTNSHLFIFFLLFVFLPNVRYSAVYLFCVVCFFFRLLFSIDVYIRLLLFAHFRSNRRCFSSLVALCEC